MLFASWLGDTLGNMCCGGFFIILLVGWAIKSVFGNEDVQNGIATGIWWWWSTKDDDN